MKFTRAQRRNDGSGFPAAASARFCIPRLRPFGVLKVYDHLRDKEVELRSETVVARWEWSHDGDGDCEPIGSV